MFIHTHTSSVSSKGRWWVAVVRVGGGTGGRWWEWGVKGGLIESKSRHYTAGRMNVVVVKHILCEENNPPIL